jgi:hypothetical protein
VGREGFVGIGTLLGGEHALGRYVVALSGFALAGEASRFQSVLREIPELRAACKVYAQGLHGHVPPVPAGTAPSPRLIPSGRGAS